MARRRPQRPRDPSQLGKLIVDLSVGEVIEGNLSEIKERTADMLQPRTGNQGVVEMLTIPAKPEEKAEEQSEAEAKKDGNLGDKTLRGNGGRTTPSA